DVRVLALDVPARCIRVRGPNAALVVEVDLASVSDTRGQRVDDELLGRGIEADERVGVRAADPHATGRALDVQRVRRLGPLGLRRQLPGPELPGGRVEAGDQPRAEAWYPEIAPRIEAQATRSRKRRVDELVRAGFRIDPTDPVDVQLAEPDAAVGRDVDAIGQRHR